MKAAWIGVPELSSLSERSLGWHGWLWNVYFPHLPASKASWSHGRRQLWRKENGLWLSTIHPLFFFLSFLFLCPPARLSSTQIHTHIQTHRHHTCTQIYTHSHTHTAHTIWCTHIHTLVDITHTATNTMYTHTDTIHRHHAHRRTFPLPTYTWVNLRFRFLLYINGF